MRQMNSIGLLPCIMLTFGLQIANAQSPATTPPLPTAEGQSTPGALPPATPSAERSRPDTTPPAADSAGQSTPVAVPPGAQKDADKPVQALPGVDIGAGANYQPVPKPVGADLINRGTVALPGSSNNYLNINTDRVRRILVLRKLLALGLRSSDIAAALPLLRNLRDINGSPNIDPAAAVEAEYQALLAAEPGTALPESSAYKLTDAAQYYRDTQAKIWSSLSKKLGNAKAEGLRSLIGQDGSNVRFQMKPSASQDLRLPNNGPEGGVSFTPGEFSGTATILTEPEPGKRVLSTPEGKIIAQYTGPPSAAPSYFQRPGVNDVRATISPLVNVPYNPNTVHISLSELIDLLEEKLKAMGVRGR